jgi:hypothetical protein
MYTVAPYSLKKNMENSRFKSTFLDNYYMLENKKYLTDVKQHQVPLLLATMTFQDGGRFAFKVMSFTS